MWILLIMLVAPLYGAEWTTEELGIVRSVAINEFMSRTYDEAINRGKGVFHLNECAMLAVLTQAGKLNIHNADGQDMGTMEVAGRLYIPQLYEMIRNNKENDNIYTTYTVSIGGGVYATILPSTVMLMAAKVLNAGLSNEWMDNCQAMKSVKQAELLKYLGE